MAIYEQKNFEGFQLSTTFGTPYETDKDRAKREIMEHMPPLKTDDEVIVIDPDAKAGIKYYKVCRVHCRCCGDVLEHENRTKQDNYGRALWCSCGKTMLDPAASFYRIGGIIGQFEDLSEEWLEE